MDFLEYGEITSDGCFLTTKDNLKKLGIDENHIKNVIHISDKTILIPSVDILFRAKK